MADETENQTQTTDTTAVDTTKVADTTATDTSTSNVDPFAELETDTREWLTKNNLTDPKAVAKKAFEQDKLIGNAIRVPGKNATPEEREAFLNKLGRPEKSDGYEFAVPKDLPEDFPYDGEKAKAFADTAHKLGLTKEQAAGLHDWFAANSVEEYKASRTGADEAALATAKVETEKLVKRWGSLDSDTFKANVEFADRVLTQTPGGAEVVDEFKRVGLIGSGDGKIVQSEPVAVWLANLGMAFFKEADVLKGAADAIGNPFADGESFNLTKAGQLVSTNPDKARSLIAAAGKKTSDFGL